jgi:hypothetical protein
MTKHEEAEMVEVDYMIGASKAELRELFAAEVSDEELLAGHDDPWLARGLEPPRRTAKALRAEALAQLFEHQSHPPAEHVLTLKEAAPLLDTSERSLRHDVDQGRYDESLTETRGGLRALKFQETSRIWRLPRARRPDPRVLALMVKKSVRPGEQYEFSEAGSERRQTYTRRRDGEEWPPYW